MQKVSVILPVYNGERYLSDSIESVLAQTHQNWELLISDNQSQDNSYQIAQSYAARDNRIICWQNEKNVGLISNHNICIERASGDYIELFAADDRFEPTCLARLSNVLDSDANIALVTCARNQIDGDGQTVKVDKPLEQTSVLNAAEVMQSSLRTLSNWIVSPVMFRSRDKDKGIDGYLGTYSDIDYWLRILRSGNLYYLNEVLFNYRVHSASATTKIFERMNFVVDVIRMADRHRTHIAGSDAPDKVVHRVVTERLLAMTNHTINELKIDLSNVLLPYTEAQNVFASRLDSTEETDYLRAHLHDYRRAVCLALLHGLQLGDEIIEAQHERNLATLKNDSLNGRIDELNQAIKALEEQQSKLMAKRDHAVSEKESISQNVQALKGEVQSLQTAQENLTAQHNAVSNENRVLLNRVNELTNENNRLSQQLQAVLNSQSWKVTALLRKVRKKLVRDSV